MLAKRTCIDDLQSAGFSFEDAHALRRISMTLHRWHELECGDSNAHNSFCITRGHKRKVTGAKGYTFEHDKAGKPFLEVHYNSGGVSYFPQPDRERGALRRLAAIMARYPGFASYVQGDPRGCALYVMRPGDIPAGASLDSCYTRGIAVYR